MNKVHGITSIPAAEQLVAGDQPQIDRDERQPAPAGAGTPVLKPAALCGCGPASIRALKRARRSAQHTASASAAIQPNLRRVLERPQEDDQRRRGAERDIVAQAVELGAELAVGAQQPRDAPVEAVEHAGDDDRSRAPCPTRRRSRSAPRSGRSTSASAVIALGTSARNGMPRAGRSSISSLTG